MTGAGDTGFDTFDAEDTFDEDYLYFYGPALAEASEGDAELIARLAGLGEGTDVLDLGCGHGRISGRLAASGAHVTGLDATPMFLERARADAATRGLEVEYVEGDMRALPWPEPRFDCVISWFSSFGYFDDEQNRRVLAEAHRVLRPGGRLLIECNNLPELFARWAPVVVVERDGNFAIDHPRFDPITGRSLTERIIIRDGRVRRFHFSVRMFLAAELGEWLRRAGFTTVDFYDRAGEPLTAQGRRMIAVARR